jgi:hypothetical protein
MPVDPRIIGIEELDRHKSVLTDAHSLSRIIELTNRFLRMSGDEFVRNSRISDPLVQSRILGVANIIQSLVLYDTLVVDSVLLDTEQDVAEAVNLFPGVIFGVHLKWHIRKKIGDIVRNMAGAWLDPSGGEPLDGIEPRHWQLWMILESSEKPLIDRMHLQSPTLIPASYANDPYITARVDREIPPDFPVDYQTSSMTLPRAHFYLELSRHLGIPLAADPIRSSYFDILISRLKVKLNQGVPEQVVANFDRSVSSADNSGFDNLVSVDLSLPPVAEYVANYARKKDCTLYEAVLEVRNSANAVRFRGWCSHLCEALELGRSGTAQVQEIKRELREVCEAWKKDVGEWVDYRTRKLNLENIPWLGGILKALNFHEFKIRDPVLTIDRKTSYFLFLNDLLRPPRVTDSDR